MSSNHADGASGIPDRTVPLPSNPNLEFEHKRAKKLLRSIRMGSTSMLERVRRYREGIDADSVKLADVQLMIAREYGFSSWPRLVSYYETWTRHEKAGPHLQAYGQDHFEMRVNQLMKLHERGAPHAAQALATFVPRFYGRSDAEVFATHVTEHDAQLAVARTERFSGWDALVAAAGDRRPDFNSAPDREAMVRQWYEGHYGTAFADALEAIRRHDAAKLIRIVSEHPEVLEKDDPRGWPGPFRDSGAGSLLLRSALAIEFDKRDEQSRAITDVLVHLGGEILPVVSGMLMRGIYVSLADISWLIDRGADPNWMPPSGVPILDWAIMRYWNPEPVDLIASRVKPRRAFWIAAGLGDVKELLQFLDRDGKPTDAARRDRPDMILVSFNSPCRPDADDLDILWEAFVVAGFNQRLGVIDALVDRGFPIDYGRWGSTLLQWAEGNRKTLLADHLLKRGAKSPK